MFLDDMLHCTIHKDIRPERTRGEGDQTPSPLDKLLSYALENIRVDGDVVYLKSLKLKVEDRVSIETLEKLLLISGRSIDHLGKINAVHVNPQLDRADNPVIPYVPFNNRRAKPRVKRPSKPYCLHNRCRCCQ